MAKDQVNAKDDFADITETPAQETEQVLTNNAQIRVECLKITYRHDRSPENAVIRAGVLERYVNGTAIADIVEQGQPKPSTD